MQFTLLSCSEPDNVMTIQPPVAVSLSPAASCRAVVAAVTLMSLTAVSAAAQEVDLTSDAGFWRTASTTRASSGTSRLVIATDGDGDGFDLAGYFDWTSTSGSSGVKSSPVRTPRRRDGSSSSVSDRPDAAIVGHRAFDLWRHPVGRRTATGEWRLVGHRGPSRSLEREARWPATAEESAGYLQCHQEHSAGHTRSGRVGERCRRDERFLVSGPGIGSLALSANGGFSYTPLTDFIGPVSFTYRASNPSGPGNVATVSLPVSVGPTLLPPSDLIAASIVGNLVTLRWTPPSTGIVPTGYVMDGGVAPGQVLASLPTAGPTPSLTFSAPTGSFYLRVRSVAGAVTSAASNRSESSSTSRRRHPRRPTCSAWSMARHSHWRGEIRSAVARPVTSSSTCRDR